MEERDFNQLLAAFKQRISKPGVSQMMHRIIDDRGIKATTTAYHDFNVCGVERFGISETVV